VTVASVAGLLALVAAAAWFLRRIALRIGPADRRWGVAATLLFFAMVAAGIWCGEIRWPRSTPNLLTVGGFNGGLHHVAFSPDGERVAFGRIIEVPTPHGGVTEAGEVALYAIDGRQLLAFAGDPTPIVSFAFRPD